MKDTLLWMVGQLASNSAYRLPLHDVEDQERECQKLVALAEELLRALVRIPATPVEPPTERFGDTT